MNSSAGYQVLIKATAQREMKSLPKKAYARIREAILALETAPRPRGCKKLLGRDEYRIRVGDYRILYTVEDSKKIVEVAAVGHRGDVYRH